MAESNLFLGPNADADTQTIRLHEPFHKSHLVDAHSQEETREGVMAMR
jgi:hypothetical protein